MLSGTTCTCVHALSPELSVTCVVVPIPQSYTFPMVRVSGGVCLIIQCAVFVPGVSGCVPICVDGTEASVEQRLRDCFPQVCSC